MSSDVFAGGRVLREHRQALKLTQRQASDRIARVTGWDVSPQELSRIENEQTITPSMESLVAIGTTYGMTPNEIAELYGYWRPTEIREEEPELRLILLRFHQLSPDTKQRVLPAIDMLLQAGLARDQRLNVVPDEIR